MRAEVVAIGTELLLGDSTDTNSAWISARLAELGIDVVRHTAVADSIGDMVEVLREALGRADVVLTTGGLGPTQDDLTRQAVAEVAGLALERDEAMVVEITEYFRQRGRAMAPTNLQQADRPRGASWLTRIGSAPGMALEVGHNLVVCLPGVPSEMRAMVDADVVPLLRQRGGLSTTVSRLVRTSGRSESGIAADLADLVSQVRRDDRATLAFLASRGETRVKVTATGTDRAAALAVVDPIIEQVVQALGHGVVGLDEEGVEHAIGRLLTEAGQTVAVAESITGGGVGARLTSVPGAGTWFLGGMITYATDTKHLLAGLPQSLLDGPGPASFLVTRALARATADRLHADYGLGIVGVAGPDTIRQHPVGLVRVAVVTPTGDLHERQVLLGPRGRDEIREFGASVALNLLHQVVSGTSVGGR